MTREIFLDSPKVLDSRLQVWRLTNSGKSYWLKTTALNWQCLLTIDSVLLIVLYKSMLLYLLYRRPWTTTAGFFSFQIFMSTYNKESFNCLCCQLHEIKSLDQSMSMLRWVGRFKSVCRSTVHWFSYLMVTFNLTVKTVTYKKHHRITKEIEGMLGIWKSRNFESKRSV